MAAKNESAWFIQKERFPHVNPHQRQTFQSVTVLKADLADHLYTFGEYNHALNYLQSTSMTNVVWTI